MWYDSPMAEIDLRTLSQNDVVLHFGGRPNEVDAFTFSTSLVALSEALLELNRQISPNLSIEITIEGIGPGSFRAKIGAKLKSLASFFAPDARELLISLLATFIYTRILDRPSPPQIIVNDKSVIVVSGPDRVIIPRKTWDAKEKLPKPKAVEKHVAKAFEIIEDDQSVSDFGFVARISDTHPIGVIQRSQFAILTRIPEEETEEDGRRVCDERTPVTVLKVIFERSSRRWQFVWRGVRISAPIKDEDFFTKLASREYVFSQGDVLDVTLRIYQIRDEMSGAFINDRYEIIKVHGFEKIPVQQPLFS